MGPAARAVGDHDRDALALEQLELLLLRQLDLVPA
jgi:hypothetical protein